MMARGAGVATGFGGLVTEDDRTAPARGLSILFLTYNRSDLLKVAVDTIRPAAAQLKVPSEIVISDDASAPPHRQAISAIGADQVLWGSANAGLSHNHNKGIRGCRYAYILSLQDDWEFVGDAGTLAAAMAILDSDAEIGVVNLMPPTLPIPRSERRLGDGTAYTVFENDGLPRKRGSGHRPYTDRPHIKRRRFAADIGDYDEASPMTEAELDFQRRVACQSRWKVAHLHGPTPFVHLGAERTFNPAHHRAQRLERQYAIPVIGPAYRLVRNGARSVRSVVQRLLGR